LFSIFEKKAERTEEEKVNSEYDSFDTEDLTWIAANDSIAKAGQYD
jgi:hypothetical protein